MRLSEELFLLLERQQHEFDKEWIAGVQKGWQQIYRARTKYPGRLLKSKHKTVRAARDDIAVEKAAEAALKYLKSAEKFLDLLQQDLLINKGFWQPRVANADRGGLLVKEKMSLAKALSNAKTAIERGKINPTDYGHINFKSGRFGYHPAFHFSNIEEMNKVLGGIAEFTKNAVDKAHKSVARVWKILRDVIDKYAEGRGKTADEPFSIGGYEPTEVNIGRMRVIFQDTSLDPSGLKAKEQYKGGREQWADPKKRKVILNKIKQAYALIKRRGLDVVWYGTLRVMPEGDRYEVPTGGSGKVTTAAGYYRVGSDEIVALGSVSVDLLIHELGHRYYYEIMSQKDRDNFDKWFGKVKAATEYGSTNTREDFAEMWEEYLKGRMKLSRDQVERFRSVLSHRPVIDEPEMASPSPRAVDIRGVPVVFAGDWNDLEVAKQLVALDLRRLVSVVRGKAPGLAQVFRRGITVWPKSAKREPVEVTSDGVLRIKRNPKWTPKTWVLEIARAFYSSPLVGRRKRSAWQDFLSSSGRSVGEDTAAKRFAFEISKLAFGTGDMDSDTISYLYWILGEQEEPVRVKEIERGRQGQSFAGSYPVPTPAQMHQRAGMPLAAGRGAPSLSALLMEAV